MSSIVSNSTTRIGHRPRLHKDESDEDGGYRIRSRDALSQSEQKRLLARQDEIGVKSSIKLDCFTIFKGLRDQLEIWPISKEQCGREMQQGLETLLASIAIQPLVTVPDPVEGWKLKLYGFIWMMSVICDFVGIAITALFLGFLLGVPSKTSWYWMCEIGCMRSIPSILVLLDTLMSLAAIGYTCWVVYGYQIGIVYMVVVAFAVACGFVVVVVLIKAGEEIQKSQ